MSVLNKEELIKSILSLKPIDRRDIIDKGMSGFDSETDNEIETLWAEESERRIDAYLNHQIPVVDANEVFRKINNRNYI